MALLVNPRAGAVRRDDADRLARLCRGVGFDVADVALPDSPEEMAEAAARCAENAPGVLVVGGDGALNAALPGCIDRPVAVGVLARGTVNVWAREIGLPVQAERALDALARGTVRSIDVGRIAWPECGAEAYFVLMAGLGFDGAVTRLVDPNVKRVVGRGAYALAGLVAYASYEPYAATIEVDGTEHRVQLTQLVVANCRRYGGDLPLAASAEPSDGWLDLWTLGSAHKIEHATRFARMILSGADPGDGLLPARAQRVRVETEHEVAVQIDGDPVPPRAGPIELSILPGALQAWFPAPSQRTLLRR